MKQCKCYSATTTWICFRLRIFDVALHCSEKQRFPPFTARKETALPPVLLGAQDTYNSARTIDWCNIDVFFWSRFTEAQK